MHSQPSKVHQIAWDELETGQAMLVPCDIEKLPRDNIIELWPESKAH